MSTVICTHVDLLYFILLIYLFVVNAAKKVARSSIIVLLYSPWLQNWIHPYALYMHTVHSGLYSGASVAERQRSISPYTYLGHINIFSFSSSKATFVSTGGA